MEAQQSITLTVLSNQQVQKTVQDIAKMPFTQFSNVYAVSIRASGLSVNLLLEFIGQSCDISVDKISLVCVVIVLLRL